MRYIKILFYKGILVCWVAILLIIALEGCSSRPELGESQLPSEPEKAETQYHQYEVGELDEIPDLVMDAANQYVEQRYNDIHNQEGGFSKWRIEALEHVYTYDDFEGMTLQVYRMNFEFLAIDPEKVVLAAGASVDEEGWTVIDYPNSTYLIFRQDGEKLSHLLNLFENDCFPGDIAFNEDLRMSLESLSAGNE